MVKVETVNEFVFAVAEVDYVAIRNIKTVNIELVNIGASHVATRCGGVVPRLLGGVVVESGFEIDSVVINRIPVPVTRPLGVVDCAIHQRV